VVPHLVRMAFGPDHRRLLPLSMLGGAILVLDQLGVRYGLVYGLLLTAVNSLALLAFRRPSSSLVAGCCAGHGVAGPRPADLHRL